MYGVGGTWPAAGCSPGSPLSASDPNCIVQGSSSPPGTAAGAAAGATGSSVTVSEARSAGAGRPDGPSTDVASGSSGASTMVFSASPALVLGIPNSVVVRWSGGTCPGS
ncbi:hypothetical protein GCM10022214_24750 [Actinomadura miaoliensis]|uniref:Uncharacterized protein n=1 Tax=Actinomadura miaoliensis TaxID=430685 RepID=A0ABP7VKF3_9ACTN